MPNSVECWRGRLDRHFGDLASNRAETSHEVFALEHGLDEQDREQLFEALLEEPISTASIRKNWLLWVVYATEQGYRYKGDEYWPSFGKATPGWTRTFHHALGECFEAFRERYKGIRPTGKWAKNFHIIAWPTAHAIIPLYLQEYFVETMYQLRYLIEDLNLRTTVNIGRVLQDNVQTNSSRLVQFLDQKELTGRLALALLDVNCDLGESFIHPSTLERVVDDIEAVSEQRTQLRETRARVRDRIKFVAGMGRHDNGTTTPETGDGGYQQNSPKGVIRTSVTLGIQGQSRWAVYAEFERIRLGLDLDREITEFLDRTRCQVVGSDRMRASGWLRKGKRMAVLKAWPSPTAPMLTFESSDESNLKKYLEGDTVLGATSPWLFRIGRDGIASQIVGRVVRPNNLYILVSMNNPLPENNNMVRACELLDVDAKACILNIPRQVSDTDRAWLGKHKIQMAGTTDIWPAGAVCRGWDGRGNYLCWTTDTPTFGLVSDHEVQSYVVSLNKKQGETLEISNAADPVFFVLPRLPSGLHTLDIHTNINEKCRERGAGQASDISLNLHVSKPIPWGEHGASQHGLEVTVSPRMAGLEALWNNQVSITIDGPATERVRVDLSLRTKTGEKKDPMEICSGVTLPVGDDRWKEIFKRAVHGDDQLYWSYLDATLGVLRVNAGEYGCITYRFERTSEPLRWIPRRDGQQLQIRLADELQSGHTTPQVFRQSVDTPVKSESIPYEDAIEWMDVQPPGALFRVNHGGHADIVAIGPPMIFRDFNEMRFTVTVPRIGGSQQRMNLWLHALANWESATLYGMWMERHVVLIRQAIWRSIYQSLGQVEWAKKEISYQDEPTVVRRNLLRRHIDGITQGLSGVVCSEYRIWKGRPEILRNKFALAVKERMACTCTDINAHIFDMALSVASYLHLDQQMQDRVMQQIREAPVLLLAARLVALVTEHPILSVVDYQEEH